MPAVTVVTAAPANAAVMSVQVEEEAAISLITAPPVVEASAGAWNVAETERYGRKPITQANAPGLRTYRFEHKVAALNPNTSIEALLTPLRDAVEKGKRVQFLNAGAWAAGWWLVRSLEITEDLKAADNTTSRATLVWDCVEASPVSKVELTKGKLKTDPKEDEEEDTTDPEVLDEEEINVPEPFQPRPGDNRTEF